jgi:16S rRNA (cytosine967-C5)-methyltransferase
MAVSPARQIAYEVLRRVEAEGAYASDELHLELGAGVKPADAALATEIVMGVLRWRRLLDFLLDRHLKKPVDQLDLPVTLALRMGAYQIRFLDRIPARAAINESVELIKRARKASAATLVNAVLHRISEEADTPADKFLPADLPAGERLGILHSHPSWMVERWISRVGEAVTVALLEANNATPRLSCAPLDFASDHHTRAEVIKEVKKMGLLIRPGVLLEKAFAVSGGSPTRTAAFRSGKISIQDEASQAVPLLLDVQSGDRVLDLCAAPGGKTSELMRAAGKTGLVVATDVHGHRLRAMSEQLERLGHTGSAHLVELDAAQPLPFRAGFERILLDAPCSGTGTLSRHPEIRWRLAPDQLDEFHSLQCRMLLMALAHLAPGGRLVYSTCSIESEENEEVVDEVLREIASQAMERSLSIRRVPANILTQTLAPYLTSGVDAATLFSKDGYFRTSPPQHQTDGFFVVGLERV